MTNKLLICFDNPFLVNTYIVRSTTYCLVPWVFCMPTYMALSSLIDIAERSADYWETVDTRRDSKSFLLDKLVELL